MTKGMGDLGVGVGTVSSAVDDAAADLRDGVAGEGERGRRDSLPEGEFDGPAAALLDGLRGGGRRERQARAGGSWRDERTVAPPLRCRWSSVGGWRVRTTAC